MVDALHEHQLSVGPFCMGLVLEGAAQFLDGDVFLQVVVVRRTEAEKEEETVRPCGSLQTMTQKTPLIFSKLVIQITKKGF